MLKFFLVTTLFFHTWAQAGDEVNNGGGIAEKTILYAFQNLKQYIDLCLSSSFCQVKNDDKDVLVKISANLEKEIEPQFISENKKNGFFIIDDELKIAKTGNQVGSPIFVNLDLLYNKTANGYEPISLSQAVMILIHELGHHHQIMDHQRLDLIGAHVVSVLERNIARIPLAPYNDVIQALIINDQSPGSYPNILIRVADKMVDVSASFQKEVICPSLHIPLFVHIPLPAIQLDRPFGAMFHNAHWQAVREGRKYHTLYLKGNLTAMCKDRRMLKSLAKYYNVTIQFKVKLSDDKTIDSSVKYVDNSLKVVRNFEPWWEIVKIPFL